MYQNLSSREKKMLLVLAVVIILSGFYVFLLRPQIGNCTENMDKLKQKREQLQKAEATLHSRKEEEKKYAEFQIKWKDYTVKLDTEYRRGSSLVLIGLKAADLGVTINKLVPGGIIDKKDYLELPLVLEVEGEYENVRQLLNEIETLSNTTEIRALKASVNKEELKLKISGWEKPVTVAAYPVNVQCDITVYSATTPGGKLYLEEEKGSAWQIGRENPFSQPDPVSPYPEVPVPVIHYEDEAGNSIQNDIYGEIPPT